MSQLTPRIFTGWDTESFGISVPRDGYFGLSSASMYASDKRGLADSGVRWPQRFGYRDLNELGSEFETLVVRVCPGFCASLETLVKDMRGSSYRLAGLEHAVRFGAWHAPKLRTIGKLYALGGNLPIAKRSGKLLVPYVSNVRRRTVVSGSTGIRVGTLPVDVGVQEFDHTMSVLVLRR